MPTSLRSGRTLRRHREVVEEELSITNKRLKKQLQTTPPQVEVDEKEKKKNKLELNDLPVEILVDILSRLPITSVLGAAKYTCKLWKLLVSDPMFLESYTAENPGCLYTLEGDSNLYFAVKSNDDKLVGMKLPGDLGNKDKYNYMDSCRGLLCYRDIEENSIYICNPVIGDVVKIPTRQYGIEVTWGFGYAPLSKQYKLFQVSIEKQPNQKNWRRTAAIFTLGGESWRDVDCTPFGQDWRISGKYCNGALYWRTHVRNENNSEAHVVSFDLETETYRLRRVLPVGTNHNYLTRNTRYLTVLGETVAYVICLRRGLQEVWTLVDEVDNIWVGKYRFLVPTPEFDSVHFTLSGLWLNKEIYGMEYTCMIQRRKMGPGHTEKITGRRCLLYKADFKTYIALQLPFAKDANAKRISPELVITHVGGFVSPSDIVAAGRKQPSLVTS